MKQTRRIIYVGGNIMLFRTALLALLLLLAACASPPPPENRYLTLEEDQKLRADCEPHGGCVAVPLPLMKQIIQALKGQRAA